MKRRIFLTALAATLFAGSTFAADQHVTVGLEPANKPFIFSSGGEYTGFSYDLWVEIAKEAGLKFEAKSMDFSALIPALQTKNIDVGFSSIFITAKRKEVVDFSDPYYMAGTGTLVLETSAIKTLADLNAKHVAAMTGSAQVAWIKANLPSAELTQFQNATDAFLALQAGRVDAVLYDYPTLAYYALTEGKGKARLLDEHAGEDYPVGFALQKGSPLIEPINNALKKIRADGRYDALSRKWFGKTGY